MTATETAGLVADSIVVIVVAVLVAGLLAGWAARVWWEDWRESRADVVSQRRWETGRRRLGRRVDRSINHGGGAGV